MPLRLVLVLFAVLSYVPVPASGTTPYSGDLYGEQFHVQYLDVSDGLSLNLVLDIAQDAEGFMWFGTQSGLNRFDGREFKHYYNDFLPGSAMDGHIRTLLVDSNNSLWVGTFGGLFWYDELRSRFNKVKVDKDRRPRILDLLEDQTGRMWVATSEGLFVGDRHVIVPIDSSLKSKELKLGAVTQLYQDQKGRVWIGTLNQGAFLYDGVDRLKSIEDWNGAKSIAGFRSEIRSFVSNSLGHVMVGTVEGGVLKIDPDQKSIRQVVGTEQLQVRALWHFDSGEIAIGSSAGLYSLTEGVVKRMQTGFSVKHDVSRELVTKFFQDESGVFWIGTVGGGVGRYNPALNTAVAFRPTYMFPNSKVSEFVTSFVEYKDGDVLIGTLGGVIQWDSELHLFNHLDYSEAGIADSRVTALATSNEKIWVGTMAGGLNLFEKGELVDTFLHDAKNPDSISANGIVDLLVDSRNRVWITTWGKGVNLFLGEDLFKRFPLLGDVHELGGVRCSGITEDENGNIWISTDGDGFFRVNPDTEIVKQYDIKGHRLDGLNLLSIKVAGSIVWLGSEAGLFAYDITTDEATLVTLDYRGPVYSIELHGDQVWFSSRNGLTRVDGSEVVHFDSTHGLIRADFNALASTRLKNGRLLFGGSKGFNILDPSKFQTNQYSPRVLPTSVSVFGEDMTTDVLSALAYDQNSFSIKFAALDYTDPSKNQYKYKLEGFDQDWIDNGTDRDVTYTNLDPGSYLLRVLGSNNDGVWSEEELQIPIVVQPPLWATWWAYTAYILLAIFLLYVAMRLNAQQHKRIAEERFSRRLELYLLSLDEAADCVFNANHDGQVLFANSTTKPVLDKALGEVIGQPMYEVVFQDESEAERARLDLEQKGMYRSELPYQNDDGTYKTLEITLTKADPPTDDVAYVGVARDVTLQSKEKKELISEKAKLSRRVDEISEKLGETLDEMIETKRTLSRSANEKEVLLRGIHDRVSDNFQMLTSLLNIQISKSPGEEISQFLEDYQQRINTMALVHEHLHDTAELRGVQMDSYVNVLASGIYRRHQPDGINIIFNQEIDDVILDLAQAVPCGLILNELLTNALDHAFTERKLLSGKVTLTLVKSAHDCVLTVSDNGKGLPANFNVEANKSMGMDVISILTDQLGGTLRLVGGAGTTFEVRFPIMKII